MKENPKRVKTPIARLSYPHLFEASKFGKFQCELIFEQGTDLSSLEEAVEIAAQEKFGDKAKRPKNLDMPFRDGNVREGEEYAGATFISPKCKDRPGVVMGPNMDPVTDPGEVYGGCYVRVSVTAFAYDQTGNKGVSFALNNVWKIRDGEPLGGRVNAMKDFEGDEVDAAAFGNSDELF